MSQAAILLRLSSGVLITRCREGADVKYACRVTIKDRLRPVADLIYNTCHPCMVGNFCLFYELDRGVNIKMKEFFDLIGLISWTILAALIGGVVIAAVAAPLMLASYLLS